MSESNNSAWPFGELEDSGGLDVSAIFGDSAGGSDTNPFDTPAAQPQAAAPEPVPAPQPKPEKPPVFAHKSVKEDIEDASMTFEELRIQKSEDFADLEEGKYVSWTVEYCGIRKEIKDPKGTTIISMKETIERSREFLNALKKSKDKSPDCLVKPKVVMKTKGTAVYRGTFCTVEEARASDKVICLIPSADGQFYEMRKQEQMDFSTKTVRMQTILEKQRRKAA